MMLTRIFHNKVFIFICRALLGGVFIYASLDKIVHPEEFARAVANYKVLTSPLLVNLVAVCLPWVELTAGVLLLAGILPRGAATVLAGLTLMFIMLIAVTMIRGIDIECGCFGGSLATKVGLNLLIRDVLLLAPAVFLFLSFQPRPAAVVTGGPAGDGQATAGSGRED